MSEELAAALEGFSITRPSATLEVNPLGHPIFILCWWLLHASPPIAAGMQASSGNTCKYLLIASHAPIRRGEPPGGIDTHRAHFSGYC